MQNDRDYQNRGGYGNRDRDQGRNENKRNRGDRGYIPGAGYETGSYLNEENITFTGSSPYTESDRNRDFGGAMMGRDRHGGYGRDRRGSSRDQGYRESQYRNWDDRNQQEGSSYGGTNQDMRGFRDRADYNPDDLDLNRGHGSRDRAIRYGDEDPDQYDYALRDRLTAREGRGSDRGGFDRDRSQGYRSDYRNQNNSGRYGQNEYGRYGQSESGRYGQHNSGRYERDRNYGQQAGSSADYNPKYDQGNLGGDRSQGNNSQSNWRERFDQQQDYGRSRDSYYGNAGNQRNRSADAEQGYYRDYRREPLDKRENLSRNFNTGNSDLGQGYSEGRNYSSNRGRNRAQGWDY